MPTRGIVCDVPQGKAQHLTMQRSWLTLIKPNNNQELQWYQRQAAALSTVDTLLSYKQCRHHHRRSEREVGGDKEVYWEVISHHHCDVLLLPAITDTIPTSNNNAGAGGNEE